MLRIVLIAVAFLLVAFVVAGFLLPRHAHVLRSTHIDAPPAVVFATVNGFRHFEQWSPWSEKDPAMSKTISGAIQGAGARYDWSGNKAVGSGSQLILDSTPFSSVHIQLRFGGFDRPSDAWFQIEPEAGGCKVSWSLDVDLGNNPLYRYGGLCMERGVAPDYERGLARLKAYTETLPKTDIASLSASLIDNTPGSYLATSGTTTTDPADIAKALGTAYGRIGAYMKPAGLGMAGAPLAVTRRWDPVANVYDFEAGIPVAAETPPPPDASGIRFAQTYAGSVLQVRYQGPYTGLKSTYEAIAAYKFVYGLDDAGDSWEQYISDPGTTPEAELVTMIYLPVK